MNIREWIWRIQSKRIRIDACFADLRVFFLVVGLMAATQPEESSGRITRDRRQPHHGAGCSHRATFQGERKETEKQNGETRESESGRR